MVMIANGLPFPTQYSLYVTESHELIAGHVQPANESGACTQLTEKGGVWKSGSTPEGMKKTLHAKIPLLPPDVAQWTKSKNAEALTRKMCWAIHKERPSIALVYGKSHWLVVTGYHLTQHPASSDDAAYQIEYLYVNNPYSSEQSSPVQDSLAEIVDYAHWQRLYVKDPVSTPGDSKYDDLHIAFIDGEPEGTFQDYKYHSAKETHPNILDEAVAVSLATDYSQNHDVFALHSPWSDLLQNIEPINASRAHRVSVATLDDDESYLVLFRETWNTGEPKNIVLAIFIGARDGLFRGARATHREGSIYVGSAAIAYLLPEEVISYLLDTGISIEGVEELYFPDVAQNQRPPELFWAPVLESLSEYLPFYTIYAATSDDPSNVVPVFLRLDGRAFLKLNEAWGA
jgi:hypothetical protein